MEEAFRVYPVFKGETLRGVKYLPDEVLAAYVPGYKFALESFMSTTKDEKVAARFAGGDLIEGWTLHVKSISCRDLSAFNPEEQEVLCPTGTRFEIVQRDDKKRSLWFKEIPKRGNRPEKNR